MRASFPSATLARVVYYVAEDIRVEINRRTYTVDLWNSSFNLELNTQDRQKWMALFRAKAKIQDFTPTVARLVFMTELSDAMLTLLQSYTPAISYTGHGGSALSVAGAASAPLPEPRNEGDDGLEY